MSRLVELRETSFRLLRYGFVGLTLNLAGYLLYVALTALGTDPKTTMSAMYVIGAFMGYFGHRRVAFNYGGSVLDSALRYCVAHLCGLGMNFVLLYYLADRLGYPHQLVQAGSILVVAAFLFVCFNFLVFPRERSISNNTQNDVGKVSVNLAAATPAGSMAAHTEQLRSDL